MSLDLDTIKTAIDAGIGVVAFLYAHRMGKLLTLLEGRVAKLEARKSTRKRARK